MDSGHTLFIQLVHAASAPNMELSLYFVYIQVLDSTRSSAFRMPQDIQHDDLPVFAGEHVVVHAASVAELTRRSWHVLAALMDV